MYYLTRGFADRGMPGFGKAMGTFYAVGIFIGALGIGNMFQSNQAYVQLNYVSGGAFDGLGWLVGLVLAAVVFAVIIGGSNPSHALQRRSCRLWRSFTASSR